MKIGDAFIFLKKSKIKAGQGLNKGEFPFFTSSSNLNKYLDSYEIEGESLIFGTGGNASVHHSFGKFSTSTDCFVVQSNKEYEIDLRYVFLFLTGNIYILENGFKGAGLKHISKRYLEDVEIPLPPLETQKKIVEVLDKAQALIDARKEQIRLMDDLVQSVFYEMFGDSKTNSKEYATYKLEELGKVGSSKRVFVDDLVENGIPFYRGTEVGSLAEGITISPKLFITEEHFVQLKNATGIPQKGDLLMPSICPDGRIWRVNTDEAFYFKDGRVLWVNVKSNDINSIYLQYALKDKFLNDYSNIASGTTFAELKIFALKNIDILMPNIELQNQYADFINQIDKMKLKVQKPLDEIEILFDLLMQKYFE